MTGSTHLTSRGKVNLLSGRGNERTCGDGVGIDVSSSDAVKFCEHLHHFEGDINAPTRGIHVEEYHLYIVVDGLFEAAT